MDTPTLDTLYDLFCLGADKARRESPVRFAHAAFENAKIGHLAIALRYAESAKRLDTMFCPLFGAILDLWIASMFHSTDLLED